jgi:tetratricopeptide (TPR) repeat protein
MKHSSSSDRDRELLHALAARIDPGDAGALNNLGVLYFDKGLHAEAVGAFEQAITLEPRLGVARRNLELAARRTGYFADQIETLRARARRFGDSPAPEARSVRLELARLLAIVGRIEEAEHQLRAALSAGADDPVTLRALGGLEQDGGDLSRAQEWLERALECDDGDAPTHLRLGEVLYNRGLNDRARTSLVRATELEPASADAWQLLAFVLGDMGIADEADRARERATALRPRAQRAQPHLSLERLELATAPSTEHGDETQFDLAASGDTGDTGDTGDMRDARDALEVQASAGIAHLSLGLAFRERGYLDEALQEYQRAMDSGEDPALVWHAMAELHLLRQDAEAAIALYAGLIAAQPDRPQFRNERGVALHQAGRLADAEESYRDALGIDAQYSIARNNLGVLLHDAGDHQAAHDALARACVDDPGLAVARLNLALVQRERGDVAGALVTLDELLRLDAEHAGAWNALGALRLERGELEAARTAFARAVQGAPDFAEAHYNLGTALSALGELDAALRETERALALEPMRAPQRLELAIDMHGARADGAAPGQLRPAVRSDAPLADFTFDAAALDALFAERAPRAASTDGASAAQLREADTLLARGAFDHAAIAAQRALGDPAARATALAVLGDVFLMQGLYGEALERFRLSRDADTRARRARVGEAEALLQLGRATEARAVAEALLADFREDPALHALAAAARVLDGEPEAAAHAVAAAWALRPADPIVLRRLGDVSRAIGDVHGAMNAFRATLRVDPADTTARLALARLLVADGDDRQAEQELHDALTHAPRHAEAVLELAAVRRRAGHPREAMRLLIDLLEHDAYNLDALLSLGETLLELGSLRDAAIAFARVRRFDPEHAGALYFEGLLLSAHHRVRAAIERWKRVVEVEPAGEYARRARRAAERAATLASSNELSLAVGA